MSPSGCHPEPIRGSTKYWECRHLIDPAPPQVRCQAVNSVNSNRCKNSYCGRHQRGEGDWACNADAEFEGTFASFDMVIYERSQGGGNGGRGYNGGGGGCCNNSSSRHGSSNQHGGSTKHAPQSSSSSKQGSSSHGHHSSGHESSSRKHQSSRY